MPEAITEVLLIISRFFSTVYLDSKDVVYFSMATLLALGGSIVAWLVPKSNHKRIIKTIAEIPSIFKQEADNISGEIHQIKRRQEKNHEELKSELGCIKKKVKECKAMNDSSASSGPKPEGENA